MNVPSLENIPRVRWPGDEAFTRDHVRTRRPVIITDLFDAAPIRKLDSLEKIKAAFGATKVGVSSEYVDAILKAVDGLLTSGKPMGPNVWESTLAEFFDLIVSPKSPNVLVNENDTPPAVLEAAPPPSVCRPKGEGDYLVSNIWLANGGNVSSLHYDGDHAEVIFYQVFGRKRIILIPPSEAALLNPFSDNSSLLPHHFSEAERRRFLAYTGGQECLLQPGETLYMPSLIWHHIEYVDHAMSINYRYRSNPYLAYLADEHFHKDMYVQNIAALMLDPEAARTTHASIFAEIHAADSAPSTGPGEKFHRMKALFKALYWKHCASGRKGDHFGPIFDRICEAIPNLARVYDRPVVPLPPMR